MSIRIGKSLFCIRNVTFKLEKFVNVRLIVFVVTKEFILRACRFVIIYARMKVNAHLHIGLGLRSSGRQAFARCVWKTLRYAKKYKLENEYYGRVEFFIVASPATLHKFLGFQ